jgi:hypothetical protein
MRSNGGKHTRAAARLAALRDLTLPSDGRAGARADLATTVLS